MAWVAAVAWAQSLAREFLYTMGAARPPKVPSLLESIPSHQIPLLLNGTEFFFFFFVFLPFLGPLLRHVEVPRLGV